MSEAYDQSLLQESLEGPSETSFDFLSRNHVWVPDQNNGSYSANTIDFDLNSLATNNQYADYKGAFLEVPLTLTVSADATVIGQTAEAVKAQVFAASMKNNICNLIHSMSIMLNNNTLIPITPFNNLMVQYKMLHSYSLDDLHNYGSVMGMSKLSPETQSYSSSVSNEGLGSVNTQIRDDGEFLPSEGYLFRQNKERLARMKRSSFYASSDQNATMMTSDHLTKTYKDGVAVSKAGLIVYHVLATIRLDCLHDYFDKCGLIKNSNYRMVFHTNANSSCSLTVNGGSIKKATVVTPNRTLPFQVSPIGLIADDTGFPVANLVADNVVQVKLSVVKCDIDSTYNHPMTQCRMYVPLLTMEPSLETKYLSDPVKTVLFRDFQVFNAGNLSGIPSGNSVNTLLTNGLTRIRKVLIFPFLAASSNGFTDVSGTVANTFGPMESPFCDEPSTLASAYCSIDDYNIKLSNVNVYHANIKYNFEHFLHEVHSDGNISSGLNAGLSSGLINQQTWDTYPHIVSNITRKNEASDDVPQSISLTFKNSSKFTVDYTVIVEYEREVKLNKATGMLVI